MTISTEHMQARFAKAIDHMTKGLNSISPGCLGARCEHAKMERCDGDVADAAADLIEAIDEGLQWNKSDTPMIRRRFGELRQALEPIDEDHQCEPSFSSAGCDTCGSSFGQDLHPGTAICEDGEIIELQMCQDCVMAFANGEQPEHWEEFPGQNEECEA